MKNTVKRIVAATLCLWLLPLEAYAADYLVPVGQVIGLELQSETVSVAAFDETLGGDAQKAGLRIGDQILDIDGTTVGSAQDIRLALERSD